MDTSKLVEGQKVWMRSGDDFAEVKVTNITEKYLDVEAKSTDAYAGWRVREDYPVTIRFYRNGEQPDWDPVRGWDYSIPWVQQDDPRPHCGKSHEPWRLVERE